MAQLRNILIGEREKLIIAATVLAFAFFWLDPLGLGSQRAQSIDNWISWFGQYRYASKASDQLAVVLIDEDSLRDWQMDWPISYTQIAGVIHQLACARVKAAFFDFTLSRRYDLTQGSDALESAIKDSSTAGPLCPDGTPPSRVPVFFGKIDGVSSPMAHEVETSNQAFWIETEAPNGVYPTSNVEFPDHPVDDSEVTPAFGILRYLCGTGPSADATTAACPTDSAAAYSVKPLLLTWSGSVDPKQALVSDTSGCRQPLAWWQMPMAALGWLEGEYQQPCPPILTLSASDLYRNYDYIAAHGDPSALLAGRIVFVGTALSGLNDIVISPVHGPLPGVFQHAVALDNLITFGTHYDNQPTPTEEYASVAFIYLLAETARFLLAGRSNPPSRAERLVPLLVTAALFALFAWFVAMNDWPMSLALVTLTYYLGPAFVDFWSEYFPHAHRS